MGTLETLFGLAGRVAIVTGGASGIGRGIAQVLAGAGAHVVVADRDGAQAEAVAAEIGGSAATVDIAEEDSVEQAFAGIAAAPGGPWLLVNCAGVQDRVMLLEASAAAWDRFQAVNLRGTFLCLREGAKAMIGAGRGGRIVNIASQSARVAMLNGLGPYAASKAGVVGLTQSAAFELAEHGITVNAVLPGGVDTPGGRGAKGTPPSGPGLRFPPPLGMCTPEDIAAAVLYLGSPGAGRISAQSIVVDGGWSFT
ncbi:SDR family NAD(P)-dependent oxidoreductase [Flavisphingomonas formosensis]|uniref:SDR family NAD(P)-dependent oxidoreductase n=1 Tax=Flavisphingomonas formosensis TaxID=861534 RepID=UPI001E4097FE|nr:SDR family NAD(P)-dependent oxidoreductase [Sphingomonas formosensis]